MNKITKEMIIKSGYNQNIKDFHKLVALIMKKIFIKNNVEFTAQTKQNLPPKTYKRR